MVDQTRAIVPFTGARGASLTQRRNHAVSGAVNQPVPHWGPDEIRRLVEGARARGRGPKGERDALLIQVLFDAALRVSEGLGVRPMDIIRTNSGYLLDVVGKRGYRQAAVSPSVVAALQSYAYERHLDRWLRFFPFNKSRAWQICDGAAESIGLVKPPGVGAVHILRHSGAIERMRITGNFRSIQDQLGHATPGMTMRYFKTLTMQESLEIQKGVELW